MALTHLVDTCVLKRLGRPEVRQVVEPLAAAARLGRRRICDLIASVTGQRCTWVVPAGTVQ